MENELQELKAKPYVYVIDKVCIGCKIPECEVRMCRVRCNEKHSSLRIRSPYERKPAIPPPWWAGKSSKELSSRAVRRNRST